MDTYGQRNFDRKNAGFYMHLKMIRQEVPIPSWQLVRNHQTGLFCFS